MLWAETSDVAHPIEAVRVMTRIVAAPESGAVESLRDRRQPAATTKQEAIAESAVRAAQELNVAAVAVFTQTGVAVRQVSRYRPGPPLLAFTTEPAVRSQLTLVWGVETFVVPTVSHTDEMVSQVEHALLDLGRAN